MTEQYFALGLVFFAVFIGIMVLLSILSANSVYTAQLNNSTNEDRQILVRKQNKQVGIYLGVCTAGLVLAAGWCCNIPWYSCLILSLVLAFGTSQIPLLAQKIKTRKRNQEFENSMLDFTVAILNSLKAGLSLPSSIESALENTGGPIYEEFSLALKEHRLGVEFQTAIQHMAQRVDSENLQLFVLTVSVCMKTGGSMVDVLTHVVTTIRQRTEFYDKLKTMVAQAEFESMMISLSPLAAIGILYLVKPDFISPLFTHPVGWCALAFVCCWETIGFIIVKKTINIKY